MKKIKTLLLGLTISSASIFAQSNDQILQKLVEKGVISQEEAKSMMHSGKRERRGGSSDSSEANLLEKVKSLVDNKYLKFGGYTQIGIRYNDMDNVKTNMAIRNAFLSFNGELLKNLTYNVLYNFKGNTLTEGYLNWKPAPLFGLQAGQQKVPIGLDNNTSAAKLDFIQYTLLTNYLIGGAQDVQSIQSGHNNGGRDLGIKMYGNFTNENNQPLVSYALGLFQGSGINTNAMSNNKDFTGTLYVHPVEGFLFGGGLYFGNAKWKIAGQDAAMEHVRNRWILSAQYKTQIFSLRSEYGQGNDGGTKLEAGYITATTMVSPKVQLAAQAEYLRTNLKSSAHQNNYSAGMNYFINKYAKIQLNYTYSDYSKKWDRKNSSTIETQFVINY